MSPSLIVLVLGLLFLVFFSLSLFGFIVVRRLIVERQKMTFERHYREIEKDILKAVSSLQPELSSMIAIKYSLYPDVLIKVLLDYAYLIKGHSRDQLKIIFDLALKEKCLKDFSSWRMIKRLRVIRLFVLLSSPEDNSRLLRLLQDKPIVRLTAISALAQTPTPETLSSIFQAFEQDSGPLVRSYFNIMFGLGNQIEPLLKEYLKKPLPKEKLGLLIELVGTLPLHSLYKDILVFMDHADKEIRIKVARAIGNLLFPEAAEILIALSSDEAWEVQAQAVKSLGKLKAREGLDTLAQALFSRYWHVRVNAGYALAAMGEEGIEKLKEVSDQNEDRYARDMASMVLNDVVYIGEAA